MAPQAPAVFRVLGSVARRLGQAVDAVGAGLQGRFASPEKGKDFRDPGARGVRVRVAPHAARGGGNGGRGPQLRGGLFFGTLENDGPSFPDDLKRSAAHTHSHARSPPFFYTVSKHRTLQPYGGAAPSLGAGAFVAPGASVVGDVTIGDRASVWYNAVVRGTN